MLRKRLMTFLLATAMIFTPAVPAMAYSGIYLADAQASANAAGDDLSATDSKIEDLENENSELQTYLTELNEELSRISAEMDSLSAQLMEKTTEVETTKGEVEKARAEAEKKYQDMCVRSEYLQEYAQSELLAALLDADDLTAFLNELNQNSELTDDDRARLEDYREAALVLKNAEEELAAELADLENLKSQNEAKQNELNALAKTAEADIAAYTAGVNAEELTGSEIQDRIDEQTAQIEALKQKAAEDEASRLEAESKEAGARALAEMKAEAQHEAESGPADLRDRQAATEAAAEEASSHAQAAAQAAEAATTAREAADAEASEKEAAEEAAAKAASAEAAAKTAAEQAAAAEETAKAAADQESAESAAEEAAAKRAEAEAAQAEAETAAEEAAESGKTYLGTFKITAYCNCARCCGTAGNATASGVMPTSGHTVAMGGIEFGTKLLINGTVYTVEDRGTPYGHVDIFFDSHSEALAFGLQYMDVYQID